ncbi:C-type lectin domain family 17, member A-like isoform X2 [Mya arenaria]|uniref:C-type lectin domain family 17, member A-like isoform X2 n=1 Tax=Mya arenaria TaxID=6604 RepID=UPI0022E807BA|nr:C-type lectin domain family 17, member A-like isoform X2 [Mya arenaria]
MKFVMILAFSFILKVALGNTVLQSSCQLDLETTVSKSLELLKNALGRGECSPTCPNGWLSYESSCFLFGNAPSTFADAETFCEDRDSHLVYIKDNSENTFLKDTAREMKPRHWWIGLTDKVVDGEWLWGDGSETTFTDWHTNEPNGDGECGHLHYGADYAWNDVSCTHSSNPSPICEK